MRKIILILTMLFFMLICNNNVYGLKPSTTHPAISYTTAESNDIADMKVAMYNTKGQGSKKVEWESFGYVYLNAPWNRENYYSDNVEENVYKSSYYTKYIYNEIIGGQEAYCLNPGLKIDSDYYPLSSETKKFADLSEEEQMYAVIYNADLINYRVYYEKLHGGSAHAIDSLPINKDTDYIIKQLLFWAYNGCGALELVEGKATGKVIVTNDNPKISDSDVLTEREIRELLMDDICSAILHYWQVNASSEYLKTAYSGYDDDFWKNDNVINKNVQWIDDTSSESLEEKILRYLTVSYNELLNSDVDITITVYQPKTDRDKGNIDPKLATTHQFFVGVYVPLEDGKNYAVLKKVGSTYTNVDPSTNTYSEFAANKTISAPNAPSGYTYKQYKVYRSSVSYTNPKTLVSDDGVGANNIYTDGEETSYTINYKNAAEYNVIVFEYEAKPKYTLSIKYYAREAGGNYTYLGSGESQTHTAGSPINAVSASYGDYTSSYCKGGELVTSSTTSISPSNGKFSFNMPSSNATLNIYFEYCNLNVAYYYKSASSNSYTLIENKSLGKKYSGQDISVSVKYNDTYNNTLYNGNGVVKTSDGSALNVTVSKDSSNNLTFDMPTASATLKIYYQYGVLTVNKVIRYNNGNISKDYATNNSSYYLSTSTYNLTADQSFTVGESLSHGGTTYYYFKYVNGSTTKYWNDSGYAKGSTQSFSKSKSNATITLYYGLRRIDYAHKIEDSTTLESDTLYKYDNWSSISNIVSAKDTPWYRAVGSTYLKLDYVKGKYKNASTVVSSDSVKYTGSNTGTEFTSTSYTLGDMKSKDNDSTRVHFYYEAIDSTKVVVRHIVKQTNGTYKLDNSLANNTTVVYNVEKAYNGAAKNQYVEVANKYSQRKSVVNNAISTLTNTEISALYSGRYSEFYEIDKNDKILVDRSRIIVSNGVYYKCQGYKYRASTSTTNPFGEADTALTSSGVITNSSIQQVITGSSGYVYIDYYYEPVTYSVDVSGTNSISNGAKLKYLPRAASDYSSLGTNNSIVTSTKTGATEKDNIAYVPATENLKPYVITDICRVRDARYDINVSGSSIVYATSSYKVWSLSDGTAASVINTSDITSDKDIVGAGKETVYNSGSETMRVANTTTLYNDIKASYNVAKSISKVFTQSATNAHTEFNNILTNISTKETTVNYFADTPANNKTYNVSSDKYNGLRYSQGKVNYKVYTVTGSGITGSQVITNKEYSTISSSNSMSVNVYTPVVLTDATIKSIDIVNHSDFNSGSSLIVQQGVTFDLVVSAKKDTAYTSSIYNKIKNTGKYIKYWYLIFDFDVTYGGRTYSAGEAIRVNANTSNQYAETVISGLQARTTSADKEIVESTLNHIKVLASTVNLPSDNYANTQLSRTNSTKIDTSTKHIDNGYIKQRTASTSPKSQSDGLGMTYDSYYLVSNMQETVSIGRIFDFEITDCLDVNFKDTFRVLTSEEDTKSTTYSPINLLTGTRYFSGIRRLMAADSITSTTTNNLVTRGNLVVGSVTKILPLGPYKHTTNTYIKSVKLGYRFSFDLKTSGYYSPKENTVIERTVKITPSYYYISKDGNTYIDNIKLYYKNSSGKYIDFEKSNYTIYYKPDDGYRNLYNSSTYSEVDISKATKDGVTTLTSSLVGLNLGNDKGFNLLDTKSMTISDEGYLQAWYGEFKLPNSTIALAVDASGNVDINNPLTNGYIGVKFDMECIDTYTNNRTVTISYDSNDTGIGNNKVNTSQWDYEGYLGFPLSNVGSELKQNLVIQLENGAWNINADRYKDIKGTVIFYDTDDRAANDYE